MSTTSSSDETPDTDALVCPGCGKGYPNRNSLVQHRRLYCRPDADPTNSCIDCQRSFSSFAGLQQHRRKAHPAAYQAQLQAQDRRVVQPFSQLETLHVVQAELEYEGTRHINVFLAERFQRPVAEIRNLRKRRGYISLRAQLEAERKDAPDHPTGSPHRFDDPTPSTSRTPPPPPRWPTPPPPEVSPTGVTVHGREGDESFDAWNLSLPTPAAGTTLAQELDFALRSPHADESSLPQSPASPDPLPPSDHEDDLGVHDPVRDYLASLAADLSTPPELALTCRNVISGDVPLAKNSIDELLHSLWTPPPPTVRGHTTAARPTNPTGNRRLQERTRRAHRYKKYQELYVKDKSALANFITRGIDPGLPARVPPVEDISRHYLEVFAGDSPQDEDQLTDVKAPTHGLYAPFIESDVKTAIHDRRASNSAGPDGMTAAALRRLPVRSVAVLFNAMLLMGYIPSDLKACRTTLIPKGGADPADVGSWRPITVANILVRTVHRMVAARMAALPIHPSQRGFVSLDGTMANSIILQAAIKACRVAARPYSVTALDLRKAFDTVPHSSIARALRRFSIDNRLSRFLLEGLTGCSTTVTCGGATTDIIPIRKGVKQGDPLSPLLFNIVIDELLCRLDSLPTGLSVGTTNISALAYADDLLLLTPTPGDMRTLVGSCVRFFEARSMELNALKCSNLTVKLLPSRSKLYLSSETNINIRATPIPRVDAEGSFKYLGHRYGYMGSDPPSSDSLRATLNNLRRAPLKPQQKIVLLQQYLIPKYLYGLQNPRVNLATLDRADKSIRRCIKEFLHLPLQTSNAILYARRKDGGLGNLCLSARIPDILLGRLDRLREKGDPHVLAALDSEYVVRLRARMESLLRPFGRGPRQATFWRHRLSNAASGAGLPEHSSHPAAHRWVLDPPSHWKGGDYVLAMQLRSNCLPTRGGLHNLRIPQPARMCRGGCQRVETISHVLQRCPATHFPRIARHDYAVRTLASACTRRGLTTDIEPSIRGTDGRLHKPDLVVQSRDGQVYIVDVSVNWETPRPLVDHYNNKVAIYSDPSFLAAVRRRYPDASIRVGAIVLGARGTWCHSNNPIMEGLGLPNGVATALVSGVLHGGCLIHRAFSAAVWDGARP